MLIDLCRVPAHIIHRGWSAPDARNDRYLEVTGGTDVLCYVEQRGTGERLGEQNHVHADWLFITPDPSTPMTSNDQVEIDSIVYTVVGDPRRPLHPRTGDGPHHLEADLRRDHG
jgi:hypothetical protein